MGWLVRTRIAERGRCDDGPEHHDTPSFTPAARTFRGGTEHQHGAGDHAMGSTLTGVAADDDEPPAGVRASLRPRCPTHHDLTAGHAARRTQACSTEPVTGAAGDLERATGHLEASSIAGVAAHDERAATHSRSDVPTGVPLDHQLAVGHACAECLET